jgi:hypothetical protein
MFGSAGEAFPLLAKKLRQLRVIAVHAGFGCFEDGIWSRFREEREK